MGWTERQFLEENSEGYIEALLEAMIHKYGNNKSS